MDLTPAEQHVLDRFAAKCRIAGGPRVGFVMRKESICYYRDEHPDLDLDGALSSLVEKDLIKVNEEGNLYFLTAAGAEWLETAGERVGV